MTKFNVTVQALLENGQSGPHFAIQLDADGYADALGRCIEPLAKLMEDSGLSDRSLEATRKRFQPPSVVPAQ